MPFWNRPRPEFDVSDLLLMNDSEGSSGRLLLVKYVRWTRLNYELNKQWVYDGLIIAARGDKVIVETGISGVPEQDLRRWC